MTDLKIIQLVNLAGWDAVDLEDGFGERIKKFAALVAATEREACAKVCEDINTEYEGEDVLATWCAAAIRSRKQK